MPDRYGDEQPRHLAPSAVAECELCDDNGYRGRVVCDHFDYAAASGRGMRLIREALKNQQRKEKA